jgi:DNA-binding GntR family transcriptional regulator
VIDTAGNDLLADLYDWLSPYIHAGRFSREHGNSAAQKIIDEHLGVIDAHKQRDAGRAEDRLRHHLLAAGERLVTTGCGSV